MLERNQLENLSLQQLFSLALYTEAYNIHFFCSWANRLRPYDADVVELLTGLADDAQQYHQTLYESSQRLFESGLPDLEPQLYTAMYHDLDLPDARYFVVSDKEAKTILGAALSLQHNTIELLTLLDDVLRHESSNSLSGLKKTTVQAQIEKIETEQAGHPSSKLLS